MCDRIVKVWNLAQCTKLQTERKAYGECVVEQNNSKEVPVAGQKCGIRRLIDYRYLRSLCEGDPFADGSYAKCVAVSLVLTSQTLVLIGIPMSLLMNDRRLELQNEIVSVEQGTNGL